jgi:hypothetical protein
LVIPEADDHVGAPAEAGVNRALSEEQAEGRVVRVAGTPARHDPARDAALTEARHRDIKLIVAHALLTADS